MKSLTYSLRNGKQKVLSRREAEKSYLLQYWNKWIYYWNKTLCNQSAKTEVQNI